MHEAQKVELWLKSKEEEFSGLSLAKHRHLTFYDDINNMSVLTDILSDENQKSSARLFLEEIKNCGEKNNDLEFLIRVAGRLSYLSETTDIEQNNEYFKRIINFIDNLCIAGIDEIDGIIWDCCDNINEAVFSRLLEYWFEEKPYILKTLVEKFFIRRYFSVNKEIFLKFLKNKKILKLDSKTNDLIKLYDKLGEQTDDIAAELSKKKEQPKKQ